MDDLEMREDVQEEIRKSWKAVNTDNIREYCDIDGYWEDFYHMFGFGHDSVDYDADVEAQVAIPSINE